MSLSKYTGANLEAIYHGEGRLTPNGGNFFYEYTLKDHLGNARASFRANGTAVTFLEETHYYPFGMQMEGLSTTAVTNNAYKYNSKEWNNDFGLGLSDYGARWYDASVGRWWAVDPMAEKYGRWSPYCYGVNNPVRFVDPNGMSVETVNPIGPIAKATYEQIKSNASPERRAGLERLEKSTVTYNISTVTAESMPGNSLGYTTGSLSKDGNDAVIDIVMGENDDATNIAVLADELEQGIQFENGELAISVSPAGESGIIGYDPFDEAKSWDASVEATRAAGYELDSDQKMWETAKAGGNEKAFFEGHGYEFNGRNGYEKPTNASDIGGGPEGRQSVSNETKTTIINREDGKTKIIRPQ
jgi:RHS repeat-associated protein